jgi:hypothetical protein
MIEHFPFNPKVFAYDAGNAYALGWISKLAYEPFDKIPKAAEEARKLSEEWGFTKIHCFHSPIRGDENNDAEAILLTNADAIVLGFRGTEPKIAEWFKTDAYAIKTSAFEPGMEVHKGFHDAINAIWQPKATIAKPEDEGIRAMLKAELASASRPVWITGHSLGGAMAVLAAAFCVFDRDLKATVGGLYTYGQPRVGNSKFAEWLDRSLKGKFFRVVNNNDVVTRVPSLNYDHAGTQKYFDSHGDLREGSAMTPWEKFSDHLAGRVKDLFDPSTDGIKDHALSPGDNYWLSDKSETYLSLLEKQLAR